MKHVSFWALGFIFLACTCVFSQIPRPVPIVETEIKSDSIRLRSAELERIKREADKPVFTASTKDKEQRFAEIKSDFESIQKNQDSIIKVYKTGKKIDYTEISELASHIRKSALRLSTNLFLVTVNEADNDKEKKDQKPRDVRSLIIVLDNTIGNFVGSPIFTSMKPLDSKDIEAAQKELRKIAEFSEALSKEANKMR